MNRWLSAAGAATVLFAPILACEDETGTGGTAGEGGGAGCSVACSEGGNGGVGTGGDGGAGGATPFIPTADDIQFKSINPMPLGGEWIVFNDWAPSPNQLLVMRPDGTTEVEVFESYRVWSLGVSADANKIAFSAGDPEQEAHYGVTLGDAIQPTFLYDALAESAQNLTYGNINDECHRFGNSDKTLFMCRREGFKDGEDPPLYRIGSLDLTTNEFSWLMSDPGTSMTLNPEPTEDGTQLYYTDIAPPNDHSIRSASLPSGDGVQLVRDKGGVPVLSPDGKKLLLQDYSNMGSLVTLDIETSTELLIAQGPDLNTGRWSPDGQSVVLLHWDAANTCSHVEIVRADGSDALAPTRIHDCAESGRSITELEWISR